MNYLDHRAKDVSEVVAAEIVLLACVPGRTPVVPAVHGTLHHSAEVQGNLRFNDGSIREENLDEQYELAPGILSRDLFRPCNGRTPLEFHFVSRTDSVAIVHTARAMGHVWQVLMTDAQVAACCFDIGLWTEQLLPTWLAGAPSSSASPSRS